jgi:hypothetical protein
VPPRNAAVDAPGQHFRLQRHCHPTKSDSAQCRSSGAPVYDSGQFVRSTVIDACDPRIAFNGNSSRRRFATKAKVVTGSLCTFYIKLRRLILRNDVPHKFQYGVLANSAEEFPAAANAVCLSFLGELCSAMHIPRG